MDSAPLDEIHVRPVPGCRPGRKHGGLPEFDSRSNYGFQDARTLAALRDCDVTFTFNDLELTVHPDSNVDDIYRIYWLDHELRYVQKKLRESEPGKRLLEERYDMIGG